MGDAKDEREKNIFIRDENVSGVGDDPVDCTDWLFFLFLSINEQIQNIAQKKDTLCRRMYN